jgi:hypothetical protein
MRSVDFAFSHLLWLKPPAHQLVELLNALDHRYEVMSRVEANRPYCGTILDEDDLPILCSGIYEGPQIGVAWTFFHQDIGAGMIGCVRIVRWYMNKFLDLTGKPIYATVESGERDAERWARVVGLEPVKGNIWWARQQQ